MIQLILIGLEILKYEVGYYPANRPTKKKRKKNIIWQDQCYIYFRIFHKSMKK